jgi:hypothetical protein
MIMMWISTVGGVVGVTLSKAMLVSLVHAVTHG